MDLTFVWNTLVRWTHIAGAVIVLGGLLRAHVSGLHVVDRYRNWLMAGALALVVSGAWQFVQRMPAAPRAWHIGIGIKILLALHVLAVSLLLARDDDNEAKRARLTIGALISGGLVLLIGAGLHNLR